MVEEEPFLEPHGARLLSYMLLAAMFFDLSSAGPNGQMHTPLLRMYCCARMESNDYIASSLIHVYFAIASPNISINNTTFEGTWRQYTQNSEDCMVVAEYISLALGL